MKPILKFSLYFGQKNDTKWSISRKPRVADFSNLHQSETEESPLPETAKTSDWCFSLTYLLQKKTLSVISVGLNSKKT